jgi:hypothetical protein
MQLASKHCSHWPAVGVMCSPADGFGVQGLRRVRGALLATSTVSGGEGPAGWRVVLELEGVWLQQAGQATTHLLWDDGGVLV